MLKKRHKLFFILAFIFVLALNVNAASKTYNYKDVNSNDLTNAQLYIYGCTDSSCSSLTTPNWNSPTSTTSSSITITGTTSSYNKEFRYVSCYKVLEWIPTPSQFYDGKATSVILSKQTSCSSSLSIPQITGTKQIDNQLTITINLGKVFSSSLTTLPDEVNSFYDASVDVKLSIKNSNNIEVYTKTDSITVPFEGKTHSFTWTPNTAGEYTIIITTNVKDCKCVQPQSDSSPASTSITVSQPTQTECDDGTDNDGDGLIDYPSDPGCASSTDDNEYNAPTTNPCTITDWECNDWSICTNSEQTRTCTKKTTCDGETGKPLEAQSCTQCSDNYDNDNDNKIDLNDPGCSSTTDNDETDLEE